MAWITQIVNSTPSEVTLTQSDATWHPVGVQTWQNVIPVGVHWYRNGEAIRIGGTPDVNRPLLANFMYFVVPWTGYGSFEIRGPNGSMQAIVSAPTGGNDFLRMFDGGQQLITEIELGPQGGGWLSASWDFHLIFRPREIQWLAWSVNRTGEQFAAAAKAILESLPLRTKLGQLVGI